MTVTGPDPSISLQRRDGTWETLGTSVGGAGVFPESIQWIHSVSQGGPTTLTFVLKVDPRRKRPDLEQFTPVSVKVGSEDVWSGRVISLSTARGEDQSMSVECEGWYQHCKDWSYDKKFVLADMTKFADARSFNVTLGEANYCANGTVSVDNGAITLTWPKGIAIPSGATIAAIIDLGPNNVLARGIATFQSSNNTASVTVGMVSGDGADGYTATGAGGGSIIVNNAGATGTHRVTTTSANARFVRLQMLATAGFTPTADVWCKVTGVLLTTDTAYESGDASVLKASDVISDTLTNRCPLISTDQSLITPTTFAIPSYAPDPGRFPADHIDAVNSYHGWNFYMTPEPTPRAVYEALPTIPAYALGVQDGYSFKAPAERNGRETYSQVTMSYQDATGVQQWTTASTPTNVISRATYGLPNPTFATDTSSWLTGGSTVITRDTSVFDSTPASGRVSAGVGSTNIIFGSNFTVTPGHAYTISLRMRRIGTAASTSSFLMQVNSVDGGGNSLISPFSINQVGGSSLFNALSTSSFTTLSSTFTVGSNTQMQLAVSTTCTVSGADFCYIDSVEVVDLASNVVAGRGFVRELVVSPSGPLTTAAAQQIAQTLLDARQLPPLKGTLEAPIGVRDATSGRRIPPWSVRSGKMVILEDEQDPNTGAFGRLGIIQTTSYSHDDRKVTLEVDSATDFVDQLLARIAAR